MTTDELREIWRLAANATPASPEIILNLLSEVKRLRTALELVSEAGCLMPSGCTSYNSAARQPCYVCVARKALESK